MGPRGGNTSSQVGEGKRERVLKDTAGKGVYFGGQVETWHKRISQVSTRMTPAKTLGNSRYLT